MFGASIKKAQKFLHDSLGWAYLDETSKNEGDGFQPVHRCKICKGKIAQDSIGGWFHLN